MTCTLHVAWDDRLTGYDFGPGHPLAPIRLKLTMELSDDFGLGRQDGVSVQVPAPATVAELELIHDPTYIGLVRLAGSPEPQTPDKQELTSRVLLMHGLGTPDDPVFPGMHEAAASVAGATLAAARAVWTSAAQHGASIAGGLHHAMARSASGFCIYNDPAIAIAWLLSQGADRIAYVDVDAHHGDGVQAAFWNDPRVLTISLHESPDTLFPGTGRAMEIGGPQAEGTSVNVALPAGTGVAAGLSRRGAAAAAGVRPAGAGQPARLRLALERPADQPGTDHRRAARRARRDPRPGARGGRRPLAVHRRRRLRARAGRAEDLDPPALRGRGPAP
jgi:acetoin utilization protein AcuC